MDGSYLTILFRWGVKSFNFYLFLSTEFLFGWGDCNFENCFFFCVKVVAIAVFLALGFAFYVFFAPFVGKKLYQYIVMGLYTPLVTQSSTFT